MFLIILLKLAEDVILLCWGSSILTQEQEDLSPAL